MNARFFLIESFAEKEGIAIPFSMPRKYCVPPKQQKQGCLRYFEKGYKTLFMLHCFQVQ